MHRLHDLLHVLDGLSFQHVQVTAAAAALAAVAAAAMCCAVDSLCRAGSVLLLLSLLLLCELLCSLLSCLLLGPVGHVQGKADKSSAVRSDTSTYNTDDCLSFEGQSGMFASVLLALQIFDCCNTEPSGAGSPMWLYFGSDDTSTVDKC